jgi:AraC family transcriptional regulator
VAASDKNRQEYEKRVNRVLDHIRAHRAEELTLDALAAVAGFSPFHFHRVFKAMTGENLMEQIQRTRLEQAAGELVSRPHVDILAIALDNGFGSASGFARAFKDRFGMSASQWRAGGAPHLSPSKPRQADRKPGQAQGKAGKAAAAQSGQPVSSSGTQARMEETAMRPIEIKVQTLPSWRVAYLRSVGPYGPAGGIQDTWQRLGRWAEARDLWGADRICLGISHDDPRVTDPAKCRYDAAIVIPPKLDVDGDVNVIDVPGGKYATAAFAAPANEIGFTYDQIFGWLPQSGYQPDHRFIFELYRGEFHDSCTGNVICDVCLPVRPL